MKNSAAWKLKHQPSSLAPLPWLAYESNAGAKGIVDAGAPVLSANGLAIARAWEVSGPYVNLNHADSNARYLVHAANNYPALVEALVGVIVGEYGMRAMRGEFGGPPTGYSTCPAWIQRAVKVINDAGEGV